ncbi:MAG: SDR family NAD(P)-dependent oxidoreductase [Chlorobi bacterium]|nr:SDR family NAD(P)-dependent oxidoreductase [Chlorobiota bacterium]
MVGIGRNAEKLAEQERELGQAFVGVAGDASDETMIGCLFAIAIERLGQAADIVVANAGRGLGGSVKDADLREFREVFDINAKGAFLLLQKAARRMVAMQDGGFPEKAADIVVVGSTVGRNISPFSAVYGSTKFAVHSLAEGLRREIGPQGVRVSLVEPGIVVSGFQEGAGYSDDLVNTFHDRFGPLLYGEDVAQAIFSIVTQPPHVHFSDVVVRPIRQDYP